MNLKEAREKNQLRKFIKEHDKDPCGDADKLDATLKSAVGKPIPSHKKRVGKKK